MCFKKAHGRVFCKAKDIFEKFFGNNVLFEIKDDPVNNIYAPII